jgi:SAM-dependent methyltransferase
MTQQASNFIGAIPDHYDRFLGPRIFNGFANDLTARTTNLAPSSLLELAAGTGIVTRRLRDALPTTNLFLATDLNPPMLDVARSKFEDEENVIFHTADATNLPYDDASFDVVVCQFGVMLFPDKQRAYEEVFRVLKQNGEYIFNVWGSLSNNPFANIANEVVTEFFPDDPPGFYQVPFGYHDEDLIQASILRAGFSDVKITHVHLASDIPSAMEFATGLVFGNPIFEEISARGGDPQEVCAAVATALEKNLGTKMPLEALVIEAEKD